MNPVYLYVREIARTGSISKAARAFDLSQPTMSLHIKRLEEQIGARVFDRSGQAMLLTEAGRVYLEYVERSERLRNEMNAKISDITLLKTGRLVIGGSSCFNAGYFPGALAVFSRKYPDVSVSVVNGRIPDITNKVLHGDVDVMISPQPGDNDTLHCDALFEENIYLCIPPDWALDPTAEQALIPTETVLDSSRTPEPFEDLGLFAKLLTQHPFIMLNAEQHIGQAALEFFKACNVAPKNTISTDQMLTSFALTTAGVGMSLITESAMRYSNFRIYPRFMLPACKALRRTMYVAYANKRYVSGATKEFVRILKECYAE